MKKMALAAILPVFFVSILIGVSLCAENDVTVFQAKLRELRSQKEAITAKYKNELQKVNNASEDDLAVIKKNFHAKRDACLDRRAKEQNDLLEAYNKKMAPILEEERKVKEEMGPGVGSNFAKRKN